MVSKRTKIKGAKKVNRKPTRSGSKNCETEIPKKKMLKKNLNWLIKTSGRKEKIEYFWLEIRFDEYALF
jgi:hypothetical protein